jgi:hypothetical protein
MFINVTLNAWLQAVSIIGLFVAPPPVLQSPTVISGRMQVQITASDATPNPDDYESGVISIEWSVDGQLKERQTIAPIVTAMASFAWDSRTVPDGAHTITAKATDGAGNVGTTSLAVTVKNLPTDTTPPTVTINVINAAQLFVDGVKVAEADLGFPLKYTLPRQSPPRAHLLEVQVK